MVAYVYIEYSTPGPCGTEKSVVLRGLSDRRYSLLLIRVADLNGVDSTIKYIYFEKQLYERPGSDPKTSSGYDIRKHRDQKLFFWSLS